MPLEPDACSSVRVRLLGVLQVTSPHGTATGPALPGDQSKTVFAHLVLHRQSPVPHERIAAAVWGDERPSSWQPALRALVTKVRRFVTTAVPVATITARSGGYLLDLGHPVDVDVEVARECARIAEQTLSSSTVDEAVTHAATAVETTTGAFLPRVTTAWAVQVRADVADVRLRALLVLGEAHLRRDEPERAARTANEAIALAPLHEASHRLAMRALAAAGEPGEAAQAFARCRTLLATELGVSPSAQTTKLLTMILRA